MKIMKALEKLCDKIHSKKDVCMLKILHCRTALDVTYNNREMFMFNL